MSVQVLVTAHSNGDFAYFPRLQTALKAFRATLTDKSWLIDVGEAWSADSWMCQATGNRAPYLVLDAMNYDAVFADGLDPVNQDKLRDQLLLQILGMDEAFYIPAETGAVLVDVNPNLAEPILEAGQFLHMPLPPKGEFWDIRLAGQPYQLTWSKIPFAPQTLPDATITGTIEFIRDEAHYYRQKQAPV